MPSPNLLSRLEYLGLTLLMTSIAGTHSVDGYLPLSSFRKPRRFRTFDPSTAIDKPLVYSVGSAVNQADSALNASLRAATCTD